MGAMKPRWPAVSVIALLPFFAQAQLPDVLLADFEGKDYGNWKVVGEAFGNCPARGTLPGHMKVDGYLGQGLVNSFYNGDGTMGISAIDSCV